MANRKLGNLGNIISSFLISEFWILPYSQNRKLGFKNIVRKFPKSSRFPTFPSFQPGLNISTKYVSVRKHTHTARMKKPRKS